MKELLHLCTKNINLIFNGEIYIQIDGVVMGSPLDPAVVNIFMAEHEKILIPKLVKEYSYGADSLIIPFVLLKWIH